MGFFSYMDTPFFSSTSVSAGLHNTLVLLTIIILIQWQTSIVYTYIKLRFGLAKNMTNREAIYLDGAACFAYDFIQLFRVHFNQIIRRKRCIPAVSMTRVALKASVEPSSIMLVSDYTKEGTAREQPQWRKQLKFDFDASKPCGIQLFWGLTYHSLNMLVNNATEDGESTVLRLDERASPRFLSFKFLPKFKRNEEFEGLMEMGDIDQLERAVAAPSGSSFMDVAECFAKSTEQRFEAGFQQEFKLDSPQTFDINQLLLRVNRANQSLIQNEKNPTVLFENSRIPLVIVTSVQPPNSYRSESMSSSASFREAYHEVTVVHFKTQNSDDFAVKFVKQLIFSDGMEAQEALDVFGLMTEDEIECLICTVNPKDTMLLPCRHCSTCYECLYSFRQEKCPICRTVFRGSVTFPLKIEREFGLPLAPQSIEATAN